MKKIGNARIVLFFAVLTIVLTWFVIFGYEQFLRRPFYAWVEAHYPNDKHLQDLIEQRVEHFGISTAVDVIVVTLLLRLINREQMKLRASEKRYRALFEHASDGIGVIAADDHRIIDVNKKFSDILGYMQQSLIGSHVCDLLRSDADRSSHGLLSNVFNCDQADGKTPEPAAWRDAELKIKNRQGNNLILSASCSALSMGKDRLFILIIRDLTEEKRLELEKREMERQLFQTSKLASIGELSAGVAHEINNPLNCIINFAQLLKDDGAALGDDQKKMLDGIIEEGDRIADIVRDLLTFARQDPPMRTLVAIGPVIENSVSLFGRQLEKDGIKVEIDVAADTRAVLADASRLRQVVVNMISNAHHALKAKRADEKVFRIVARNLEREGRPVVHIEFYDNGTGIAREQMDKIFDPFFTTRRDSGGTGLGLSLSFAIIRDYDGRIMVDSREGSYTRFTVELPADSSWEADYAESVAGRRRAEYSVDDGRTA
ncbi:MAG TPA: ATP-binding protein [Blastocatellia bacterium]|nr:ATP-binding protein [Blastocatellia bacterium]